MPVFAEMKQRIQSPVDDEHSAQIARQRYWPRVRTLTMALLCIWFAVNLGVIFFARELASLTLGGWPMPFYMAAQGTTLPYQLIIGGYAYAATRLEREAGTAAGKESGHETD